LWASNGPTSEQNDSFKHASLDKFTILDDTIPTAGGNHGRTAHWFYQRLTAFRTGLLCGWTPPDLFGSNKRAMDAIEETYMRNTDHPNQTDGL
jgi:hypothetical protein